MPRAPASSKPRPLEITPHFWTITNRSSQLAPCAGQLESDARFLVAEKPIRASRCPPRPMVFQPRKNPPQEMVLVGWFFAATVVA